MLENLNIDVFMLFILQVAFKFIVFIEKGLEIMKKKNRVMIEMELITVII